MADTKLITFNQLIKVEIWRLIALFLLNQYQP